jgi:hypothetical protein
MNNKFDIMVHHLLKVKMQRQHIRKESSPLRRHLSKDSIATDTFLLLLLLGNFLLPPHSLDFMIECKDNAIARSNRKGDTSARLNCKGNATARLNWTSVSCYPYPY